MRWMTIDLCKAKYAVSDASNTSLCLQTVVSSDLGPPWEGGQKAIAIIIMDRNGLCRISCVRNERKRLNGEEKEPLNGVCVAGYVLSVRLCSLVFLTFKKFSTFFGD